MFLLTVVSIIQFSQFTWKCWQPDAFLISCVNLSNPDKFLFSFLKFLDYWGVPYLVLTETCIVSWHVSSEVSCFCSPLPCLSIDNDLCSSQMPLITNVQYSMTTRSSAVAERPRDASCLSVANFNIQHSFFINS